MKKNKDNKENKTEKKIRHFEKGEIIVKVMAGILAILMVFSIATTLIYALFG